MSIYLASRTVWLLLFAVLTLVPVALVAEPMAVVPAEPVEMQQARLARWQQATDQILVLPFFEQLTGQSMELFVANRFSDSVDVEIVVTSLTGDRLSLGGRAVAPRSTLRVDLSQELESFPRFRQGALRLLFFGDSEMLQAWVITRSDLDVAEWPLFNLEKNTATELVSYWDSVSLLGTTVPSNPRFAFHNTAAYPVSIVIEIVTADGETHEENLTVDADATRLFQPLLGNLVGGALARLVIDGSPSSIQVSAATVQGSVSAALPVMPWESLQSARVYESLPVPWSRGATGNTAAPPRRLLLSFADSRLGHEPQGVRVELIDALTGRLEADVETVSFPGSVRVVQLTDLLKASFEARPMRLRVVSQRGGLACRIIASGADQQGVVEVPLFDAHKVHASGQYPLPPISMYDVETVFVNLGNQVATILGHISHPGGDFALRPFTIPAYSAHVLEFNALPEYEPEDMLGRRLPADYDWGFFQWTARSSTPMILARTYASEQGRADSFGFNCFGCCEEMPVGGLVPESIDFDLGQAPSFATVEWLATCTGTIGPYYISPISLTYASPVSWDSQIVSSSGLTNQNVAFHAAGSYEWFDCSLRTRNVFGGGNVTVDRCQKKHNPDHDPAKSCFQQQPTCSACYTCCEKQRKVGDCRCKGNEICKQGVRAACGTCKQACFGHFNVACDTQQTACFP